MCVTATINRSYSNIEHFINQINKKDNKIDSHLIIVLFVWLFVGSILLSINEIYNSFVMSIIQEFFWFCLLLGSILFFFNEQYDFNKFISDKYKQFGIDKQVKLSYIEKLINLSSKHKINSYLLDKIEQRIEKLNSQSLDTLDNDVRNILIQSHNDDLIYSSNIEREIETINKIVQLKSLAIKNSLLLSNYDKDFINNMSSTDLKENFNNFYNKIVNQITNVISSC